MARSHSSPCTPVYGDHVVDTRPCSFHSLSPGEAESDTEEPAKKTVAEGKEAEAEDEAEAIERKGAKLKAEEVARH